MPRTLTPRAIIEAQRQNSNAVFLVLLTIQFQGWWPDLHVVNNSENITSRGMLFYGWPFKITLPEDVDSIIAASATVEIDNVDPVIWQSIRALHWSPTVVLEVIISDEPDSVVLTTTGLRLREASVTSTVVSATLIPDSIWQTGYPISDYDPAQNPGMFA